ncbi:uncharacterized protein E0L32_008795 [Thyridium curvatum]|uniref:RecA family profile 1 domain-containing protein n=1 Tax=Thyridium curvatum TaxID=1093900 RepID=A0A507AYR5_9PEZI|nr:uncharacterized protein E0L32_008795 [Thyridium curvatum]TPX09948.1 hypothetical protein E0L32_008795 [Thyridium curvatum]
MTDLLRVLPDFPTEPYAGLLPALERHAVTTSDLLTLEVADIGKRTQLPLLDIKRLANAVLRALHEDLGVLAAPAQQQQQQQQQQPAAGPEVRDRDDGEREETAATNEPEGDEEEEKEAAAIATRPEEAPSPPRRPGSLQHTLAGLESRWSAISTLDARLDAALGGGIPTGYVTEIAGESGAGKTQLLLSLLLAVQLAPEHGGLGRPALYISTEAPLSTRRLSQMLAAHPSLCALDPEARAAVSLDRIHSAATPDLESQEHILTYQVPVQVERHGIGLLVLDSVAANYRAEFDRGTAGPASSSSSRLGNMAARGAELVRLGMLLRDLARRHNLAVVVANQVADRFNNPSPAAAASAFRPPPHRLHNLGSSQPGGGPAVSQESPLASRSRAAGPLPAVEPTSSLAAAEAAATQSSSPPPPPPPSMPPPPPEDPLPPPAPPALLLDHQQRWFTGWGDDPFADSGLKTPSLGLVWTTQVAMRIALLKRPAYGRSRYAGDEDEARGTPTLRNWRRWMKVVFAPHVAASGMGLDGATEFEVTMAGVRAVVKEPKR